MTTEFLAEIGQAYDLMEELAARAELQDDVVILTTFGEIKKLDDIWVVDLTHDLYFFEDVLSLFVAYLVSTPHRHCWIVAGSASFVRCGGGGELDVLRTSTTLGCFLKSG